MDRKSVIDCMVKIKELKPKFFLSFSKEDKERLVDIWLNDLGEYRFDDVMDRLVEYIKLNNSVPYPQHLKQLLMDIWHQKYGSGTESIRVGDKEYRSLFDWNDDKKCWGMQLIPTDILSRIVYDPALNDEETEKERQELIKQALAC